LFSSIGRPVASGVTVSGAEIEPQPPATVHAGTPLLIYGSTSAADSALRIAWEGGGWLDVPLHLESGPLAETARLLRGARLITDFESRYSEEEEAVRAVEKRKAGRAAAGLKALSEEYGLASREMSLVAVVKRDSDKPGQIPETRVVPVGMAQDVEFGSYFRNALATPMAAPASLQADRSIAYSESRKANPSRSVEFLARRIKSTLGRAGAQADAGSRWRREQPPAGPADRLLDLAARIEPDGGMPGRDFDHRIAKTLAALRDFLKEGHTAKSGAFRAHVKRLAEFLRGALPKLGTARRAEIETALREAGVTV
jgi:hypothetical protein